MLMSLAHLALCTSLPLHSSRMGRGPGHVRVPSSLVHAVHRVITFSITRLLENCDCPRKTSNLTHQDISWISPIKSWIMSLIKHILRYADYQRLPVASSETSSNSHWTCPKITILGLVLNLATFLAGGLMAMLAIPAPVSSPYSQVATCRTSQSSQSVPEVRLIPPSVFFPSIPTVMEPDKDYVAWNDHSNRNWRRLTERSCPFSPFCSSSPSWLFLC